MRIVLIAALFTLAACNSDAKRPATDSAPLEAATIVGSAQSPDPVLEKVRALEKSGVVKDVMVMESFPVQIRLRAPKQVIEELQAMPRTGALR